MKLPGLIDLSLILILVSSAKGDGWIVNIPNTNITAESGKDVTIHCNFSYPKKHHTKDVKVYWKKNYLLSSFDTQDNDKKAFIFHPNDTFVLEKYRKRTSLIGNKDAGNCSLKIQNVTENEQHIYVRVIGEGDQYSFVKHDVFISLPGVKQPTPVIFTDIATTLLPTSENSTRIMTQKTSTIDYTLIFVPVAVVLIIIVIGGIVFCIKHKRSKSFTRQDSGYYANFRRPSSHQENREAHCKKQDKELPEPKAIDEPVYINMEAPRDQMDQSMDHTESVYANVDYSK